MQRIQLAGCDLAGAYLAGADFSGVNLVGVNLSHSILSFAHLSVANLVETNLSAAILSYTSLHNTIWDECGITDNNGDGYDDVSYDAGAESGDVNLDGELNILDLVSSVNMILNP